MTIYVLVYSDMIGYVEVEAAFSSREKAEAALLEMNLTCCEIQSCELDGGE